MLIPGTDGEKMSKSRDNTINIFLPDKQLRKQIMGIATDSTPLEEPKNPETCNVFALDLPGLGDSAMCAAESDAESAAEETRQALLSLFEEPFHIVAFSWGCTISAMIMKSIEEQLLSVMLTGPAAVGPLPHHQTMQRLLKRTPEMTREEVFLA